MPSENITWHEHPVKRDQREERPGRRRQRERDARTNEAPHGAAPRRILLANLYLLSTLRAHGSTRPDRILPIR